MKQNLEKMIEKVSIKDIAELSTEQCNSVIEHMRVIKVLILCAKQKKRLAFISKERLRLLKHLKIRKHYARGGK